MVNNIRDINLALINGLPDEAQEQIYLYLTKNYCKDINLKPKSASEIMAELAESRVCFERGEYRDYDDAVDELCAKYGV